MTRGTRLLQTKLPTRHAAPVRPFCRDDDPSGWATDFGGFLQKLGLQQYRAAFRDNGIDVVLPKLAGDDARDLGITMVGHGRILLEAIAMLREPTAAATPGADVMNDAPIRGSKVASRPNAARSACRSLSVPLAQRDVCDLIGSTALSAQLDPANLREVIRSYQARIATPIQLFDGFLVRYVGDGVLICFG
jgi:hypothetical protein